MTSWIEKAKEDSPVKNLLGKCRWSDVFTYTDKGSYAFIGFSLNDAYLKILKDKLPEFRAWLEHNFMDDMDAGSWYGCELAMQKAREED